MFTDTATILRPGVTTLRSGDEVPDYSTATQITIVRILMQPAEQSTDVTASRDAQVSRWRMFSEPGTAPDIRKGDRLLYNNETLDLVGDARVFPDHLLGGVHHLEALWKRATG